MDSDDDNDEDEPNAKKAGNDYLVRNIQPRETRGLKNIGEVTNTLTTEGPGWRRVGTYDTLYHQVK